MESKSCKISSERRFKYTTYESTSQKNFTKERQLSSNSSDSSKNYGVISKNFFSSSSSSDDYGVIRKKWFRDQKDNLNNKDYKRRKVHKEDVFVGDSDYLMYLKLLTGDKEKDKDDSDKNTDNESEDYDVIVVDDDEEDEENEDSHVDMDSDMVDMSGNGTGAGNELNPDDSNDEDVEESEDIQVDVGMGGDSGDGIDVGDELDPEYKMFCENLRENGESYILEMEREKGDFEPSLPPSCSKDDIIPPTGEHNKVTLSVPEKSSKDGFPCSKDLQFEEDNRDTTSDPGKSMKDGLCYCTDPAEKPHKSCDSQTDEDDLGTDCTRTEYKKKLEKCINMPYDAEEFADKWEFASTSKECERISDTGGRSVPYATEKTSRSYLDFHPDLAELVDRALERRDGCRALLLLRLLFFYNEHAADEGAFIPWKDPSFERMLLGPV
ncbi:hypothetical protein MKX01_018716 [Papaver californicum]|nr:hypothetical protein MKX01_018716 [Papaver californicum]